MPRRAACALILFALACPAFATQPQLWKLEGARDFLDGETDGLSVDSEGRLRIAPAARSLGDPATPNVWALCELKGVIYAATGNDGKVFRIEAGQATLLFDAPEMEVHALAAGPDGRLYAATSPDGKVYALDASGKSEVFFDPEDRYIWALAFDRAGNLLVATGSEGRLLRVDRTGKSSVLLSGAETHITALTLDAKGNIYAGSAPGGVLYRVDPAGKVFVLYDSPFRELRAIDVGEDGSVYAAVIEGKDRDDSPRPPTPQATPAPAAGAPVAEVSVSETFTLPVAVAAPPGPSGQLPQQRPTAKGAVFRVFPGGEIDTLWSSNDDTPYSLLKTPEGLLVGTGGKGKVFLVRDDRTWTMVQTLATEQVTALRHSARGTLLGTANPGVVYLLDGAPASRGSFTSKAKDTETVSTWGRVRWDALTPPGTEVQIQSRSGNTSAPDNTWAEWSAAYTHASGDPVRSPHARYVQLRAVLQGAKGATPVLDTLALAYLQRNLRPQVQWVSVHPPGEVFQKPLSVSGEAEILGVDPESRPRTPPNPGMPPITSYSRKVTQRGMQTLSWKADDPNGDTLAYDVSFRAVGDTRFRLLRKGVSDTVLAWDTSTVPNGRYVARVTASDAPSNPDALALTADKESAPFEVDNTPPTITLQRVAAKLRVEVRDDSSVVRRTEYSIDGGRWLEVYPTDGINDALEESYEFELGELAKPGPHLVVVRSSDLLGNQTTARIEVP